MSDHVRKRMFEKGISLEEVTEAIKKGRRWREAGTLHATIRSIEVVYKIVDSDIFVITVQYR